LFAVAGAFRPTAPESPLDRRPSALRLSLEKTLLDKTVTDLSVTPNLLQADILRHLTFTVGKDAPHASVHDWRMALSHAIRDRIVEPWFASTRRTWAEDKKRVYYLSMEFLIGRILEDATINLGLYDAATEAMAAMGVDLRSVIDDEPDAALGNGGLGRLAACFMESMATLGCPAYGYGIRYEHGLFRQHFDHGRQIETPENWLAQAHPWEFARPESAYTVGFKGHVETRDGREIWYPQETVTAEAFDTPVIGWQGKWANTLRLWGAKGTTNFDLERFNRGDYTAAAEPETLARTLSRVLYPDDTTYQGKELRRSSS
jgi:starch phosphorylase